MPFTQSWNQLTNIFSLGTSKSKFLYYIIHKKWFIYIQNSGMWVYLKYTTNVNDIINTELLPEPTDVKAFNENLSYAHFVNPLKI